METAATGEGVEDKGGPGDLSIRRKLGCSWRLFYFLVGLGFAVASVRLGPLDATRTVYNQLIGDSPVLKRQLLELSERGLRRQQPQASEAELQELLSRSLELPLKDGRVDPQDASIELLWDAAEDAAPSWYQRRVWTSL